MVDGGLRVVLDFDASAIQAATDLLKVKQAGGVLEIAAVPIINPPLAAEEVKHDRPKRHNNSPYAKQAKTEA